MTSAAITAQRLATSDTTFGPVVVLGTPRRFIAQGKPNQILSEFGLDVTGIVSTITSSLASLDTSRQVSDL